MRIMFLNQEYDKINLGCVAIHIYIYIYICIYIICYIYLHIYIFFTDFCVCETFSLR